MAGTTPRRAPEAPSGPPERPGEKPEGKTPEELGQLEEELDETGKAEEYIETFKKGRNFEFFATWLEFGMHPDNTQGFANFENWTTADSEGVAQFFDTFQFAPRGKGRMKFVNGLRADPESEEFKKSRDVLEKLVKILRGHFEKKREGKADVSAQVTKHPMGDTIGNGVKTLMKNFNRAQGTEKLMILAAVGIGIVLINKYKDEKVPWTKDMKWSRVFLTLGALWGVNYLSGKVSQDGRTLTQRLDVMRDIDDMKPGSALHVYAESLNMGEDQEMLRTYHQLIYKGVSVKKLFDLYEETALATNPIKEIDPKRLGFYRNEIDGKAAYKLMKILVEQTSVNEYTRMRHEEAASQGMAYGAPTDREENRWKEPDLALAAFRKKYILGKLGSTDQTYFDAIINEEEMETQEKAARRGMNPEAYRDLMSAEGRAKRKPDIVGRKIKAGAERVADAVSKWAEDNTRWGGKWIYTGVLAGAKHAWEFTRDDVLKPTGQFLARKYRTLAAPHLKKGTEWLREKKINEVLSADFAADVTTEDKVTLMGLPGNNFEIEVGKGLIIINGIQFDLDKDVKGNATNALRLETDIRGKVIALIAPNKIPGFDPKNPKNLEWDKKDKKWAIKDIPIVGGGALNIPGGPGHEVNATFTIEPNEKVKFYRGNKEIKNFADLEAIHAEAVIEEAIWKADPALEPYLQDLPVTDIKVNAGRIVRITGKLGGLDFTAKPKTGGITAGVDFLFLDPATGLWSGGGFNKLKIDEANGGPKFLTALSGKIFESDYFKIPFIQLQAQMENTSEGVFARMKELFPTTRLWIIPTSLNLTAGINGKILQERWRYTLDFKKYETLQLFEHELQGKTIDQIPNVYKKYIVRAHNDLTKLWRDIDALSDEDKAKDFEKNMDRLESLNYENTEYRQFFEQYQQKITDPRYNYNGFESLDVDYGAREANEMYQTLLLVWSHHTRKYMKYPKGVPLAPNEKSFLQNKIIDKVVQKLEKAMKDGGGTIQKEHLPAKGSQNEGDLDLWVK